MKTYKRIFQITWPWLLTLVFVFTLLQICHAKDPLHIPQLLDPWKEWVLHGKEEQLLCVPQYNNDDAYQCAWPSVLELRLNDKGGEFRQSWLVHSQTWVTLPGNDRYWPREILVDGTCRVILGKENSPSVQLLPGTHTITGRFSWQHLPEHIQVPRASGLLSLTVNDETIKFPDFDTQGRLWLKRSQKEEKIENRLKLECFRLIDDSIPARVTIKFHLDVAGSARQITLGPLYSPDRFTPVSLKSPLPARLEQNGQMRLQVKPGRYRIQLDLRHSGPLHALEFIPPEKGIWPDREIWSFSARPDLRLVEIRGVPSIDPLQTSMPRAWQNYPAYLVQPKDKLEFKELKRGDPVPAPDQLTLDRTLWLKFDGSGYTIQDRIQGKKNTNWRLEMDPAITLGQVITDGKEQLITQRKGSDKAGIELRNGRLDFKADSIIQGDISLLPATGWDHNFQKVKGRLHLPPGWTLLNAGGMDNIPRTWIKKWTLLDFFVVLIFTIALAKLYSKPLAGIALLTLVLIFHEPNAPKYVWLTLLIGFALLKHLPEGGFKSCVKLYQGFAVLAFVVIVIPYSIQALRIGIYPQLAQPWTAMTEYASRQEARQPRPRIMDAVKEMAPMTNAAAPALRTGKLIKGKGDALLFSTIADSSASYQGNRVMQYDPKALTQTGPGMPLWRPFETINFSWSGPVTRDQTIKFTLIGPRTNLILAFARISLILLLALGLFGIGFRPGKGFDFRGMKKLMLFSALLMTLLVPVPAQTGEIPPGLMLEELERRLLEKDRCFPACADISHATIHISPGLLTLEAHVNAQLDVAIPIPGHESHWLPRQVRIDDSAARGIFREKNRLWIMVPKGRHRVELKGPVRNQNTFQLPFHLKPRHLDVKAEGWTVEGLHNDGTFDARLQFKRILKQDNKGKELLGTGILPPFARVERTILLGLVWKVHTRVVRIGQAGSAVVMGIPLLPGESVTTQGIRVVKNVAKINLRANQTSITWDSFLDPSDQIRLVHPKTNAWTELWKVDVSPVFHMEYDGIPVILHKTGNRWYPTWHPWPGEAVNLMVSRPPGIKGQTLTIEKSLLTLRPGRNTTTARMNLSLKSSQGGHHAVSLPQGARLQEVKIQGKLQPIRQDGIRVVFPVTPGNQEIELTWIDAKGISTQYKSPGVDLGIESVNSSVDIFLPHNRWPLFIGGDQLVGPAVLFWSVLIIVLIIAFGLSRTGWTQLRFRHWFLLCMGMSMSNMVAGIFVIGWLIALDFRKRADSLKGGMFNLVQAGIVILTIAAAGALMFAISNGLLGHPDMNIKGNGSTSALLRWYHDVSGHTLPRAWVISIPMLAYRIAMLAWALWISFWLIGIVKWGWQQFTTPYIWQKISLKIKKGSD